VNFFFREFRMSDFTPHVPLASSPKTHSPDESAPLLRTAPAAEPRLRLWPGVALVLVQWLLILVPGWLMPGTMTQFIAWFWGPMVVAAGLALWWVLASRLRWSDRWLVLLACAGVGLANFFLYHKTFGGFGVILYALPLVTTAWVVWLLLTPWLRWPVRRAGLLVVFLLAWGLFTQVRFEGVTGSFSAEFAWRWNPTAEEKFLADSAAGKLKNASLAPVAAPLTLQPGDWPGFRGPDRDGRRTGIRIATDWKAQPPRLVWRHRVGPGWSSFAVVGPRLYTQEQRGENEVVVCYDANSGAELWTHEDSARFSELVSGAGPRATPTFHEGKIYALGGAGRLNCLDAATGDLVWSHDIVTDSGAKVPTWGFSASPLVVHGVVTVFAGGPDGKSVLGYHAASGELAWSAGKGQYSYCSLHPARLGGVEQLLLTTDAGLTAFDPVHGTVLWQHDWQLPEGMTRVVQPTLLGANDVLIGTGFDMGTRRVGLSRAGEGWATKELWTTRAIKPYFNDLVVHKEYIYGFDNNFLTCVSLAEYSKGKWRARGYGNGQVLLLADQDLLLILAEQGAVALVEASPEGHKERGRFQALEGKTWNHPVVAYGKLFVRNSEEAACYQLADESLAGK
jgi:outer membrane protein assembly factor BamB